MDRGNSGHQCEPKPRSRHVSPFVQPVEAFAYPLALAGGDAMAIVRYDNCNTIPAPFKGYGHPAYRQRRSWSLFWTLEIAKLAIGCAPRCIGNI